MQSNEHNYIVKEIQRLTSNNINKQDFIETYVMNLKIFENAFNVIG